MTEKKQQHTINKLLADVLVGTGARVRAVDVGALVADLAELDLEHELGLAHNAHALIAARAGHN